MAHGVEPLKQHLEIRFSSYSLCSCLLRALLAADGRSWGHHGDSLEGRRGNIPNLLGMSQLSTLSRVQRS